MWAAELTSPAKLSLNNSGGGFTFARSDPFFLLPNIV